MAGSRPAILIAPFVLGVVFAFVVPAAKADPIEDLRNQIAQKDAAVQALEERAKLVRGELSDIRGREKNLSNQITSLDRQIESLQLEIDITQDRIERADLRIQELFLEISKKEDEIKTGEARIGEVLRTMQVSEDKINSVDLIFAGRPFSEVFDSLRSAEVLNATLAENVEEVKKAKAALEEDKRQSEDEKRQASELKDQLSVHQALLSDQQDERQNLLNETKQEDATYQQVLKGILAQQQAVQREILDLESKLRRAINPSALPGKGVLIWPVASVRITQRYGPTSSTGFTNDQYEFHNGVDFGSSSGSIGDPILAAGSGVVVGVGNDGKYAYGKWVAINHQNGLVTLYGHLSIQQVSIGQRVSSGQQIGLMGSTGFSTGPHLHFTVYASDTFRIESRWYGALPIGGSLNPMNYF